MWCDRSVLLRNYPALSVWVSILRGRLSFHFFYDEYFGVLFSHHDRIEFGRSDYTVKSILVLEPGENNQLGHRPRSASTGSKVASRGRKRPAGAASCGTKIVN